MPRFPKPNALRLAGSDRPSRRRTPPTPPPASLEPPEWITGDALDFWNRNAPLLIEQGVLRASDVTAFCVLCETYSTLMSARREMVTHGIVYTSGELTKVNPAASIYSQTAAGFLQLAGHFGLTPLSRQRLDTKPTETTDELEAFLNRNNSTPTGAMK